MVTFHANRQKLIMVLIVIPKSLSNEYEIMNLEKWILGGKYALLQMQIKLILCIKSVHKPH